MEEVPYLYLLSIVAKELWRVKRNLRSAGQFPISSVVSMGRRNTQLEPTLH